LIYFGFRLPIFSVNTTAFFKNKIELECRETEKLSNEEATQADRLGFLKKSATLTVTSRQFCR